jgi:ABC-type transport system involved in multi-copper enzyme maturation permease subunit
MKETLVTLNFQIPRRRFWLLWLLALTPFFFLPLIADDQNASVQFWLTLIRLLLVGLALALVNGAWFIEGSARSRRLAKEFRLQLPGAVLAIFIPAFLASIPSGQFSSLAMFVYVVGCAALGTMAFSAEFEHRTMGVLLAQPLPRSILLTEKLAVMAALLALALAQLSLAYLVPRILVPLFYEHGFMTGMSLSLQENLGLYLIPPLFAFCTGSCIALLTRRTLAAGVFTVAVPPALGFLGAIACGAMLKWRHPDLPVPDPLPGWKLFLIISTPAYLLAGLAGCWWQFHRLQWRENAGAPTKTVGHPFAGPMDRLFRLVLGGGSTAALVRKEMRLHVAPWLTALLSVALWGLWMGAKRFSPETFTGDPDSIVGMAILLGVLTIMVTGAAIIAEERELGTLDWQLTQPISLRRQWWIKVGVAFVIAAALGVVLPAGLVLAGLGVEVSSKTFEQFTIVTAVALGLFPCAIYASSLSRSTVNAAVLALVAGIVFSGVVALPLQPILRMILLKNYVPVPEMQRDIINTANVFNGEQVLSLADHSLADIWVVLSWVVISLWGTSMISLLLVAAWGNLRSNALTWARSARQIIAVAGGMFVITAGFAGIATLLVGIIHR